MTNNPNQHQPDGDGLRNRILNLIPDIDVIPLDRASGLLREIRAICLAPPTRDGAEEVDICPLCSGLGLHHPDCPSAPPKPAPDAVREEVKRTVAFMLEGHSFALTAGKHHKQFASEVVDFVVGAISAPVPSPGGARREVEATLQMISNAAADAALRDPSPAVAAEPVDVQPNYETAARALGFQQIPSGSWFHPNQHPDFTERFKTAEAIFDRYFGKHWPPVKEDREAIAQATPDA